VYACTWGLRPRSGALPFDPRLGASPTFEGFAFRPTLGGFAHARGLCLSTHAQGLRPRSGALPFDPRLGLCPRSGASPTLGGFAHARGLCLSTHARGLRLRSGALPFDPRSRASLTLGGCTLSTYTWELRSLDLRLGVFCPPDLRLGAPPFCPRRIRHIYTIYTQSGGTDAATGLVHGAAAPWFALC
jgi:hypothetical protein